MSLHHHHVNLSPLPNHSLCKSQRDLLKNANLIRSYLGLRSLQWLSTTHRKIKIPGRSYEPLSCSYPFLNIPLLSATPVFSSSFSNEPCLSCHWAFAPALPTTILPISTYSSFRSLPNCARWSPFYVFIVIHIFSSQESRLSYDMELFNVWFPPYSVSPMRAGMGSVLCGPSPTTVELFGIYWMNVGPCRLRLVLGVCMGELKNYPPHSLKVPQRQCCDKTGLDSSNCDPTEEIIFVKNVILKNNLFIKGTLKL